MELNEAKEVLKKNGYLVESDNYVKDFTDEVIEPLDAIIVGLKYTIKIGAENQIDAEQLLKDLSEIKDKCEDTRNLLRAFKIKG
jgi:hypothetical protein